MLNKLKAVTSIYYLKAKFPIAHGIGEIKGDQVLVRECYQAAFASRENNMWMIEEPKLVLELSKVPQEIKVVPRDLSKVLKIGSALSASEKTKITDFLRGTKTFSLGSTRI